MSDRDDNKESTESPIEQALEESTESLSETDFTPTLADRFENVTINSQAELNLLSNALNQHLADENPIHYFLMRYNQLIALVKTDMRTPMQVWYCGIDGRLAPKPVRDEFNKFLNNQSVNQDKAVTGFHDIGRDFNQAVIVEADWHLNIYNDFGLDHAYHVLQAKHRSALTAETAAPSQVGFFRPQASVPANAPEESFKAKQRK